MENLLKEIIPENPTVGENVDIQIQEGVRILNRHDQNKTFSHHITV
jgi:hypothetical protein